MRASTSRYSASIFSRSRPVSLWRRRSRMAWAWISENWKFVTSPFRASSGEPEARIRVMISSIRSMARRRPSRMWKRSRALRRRKRVRRVTTSWRKWRKTRRDSASDRVSGRPLTIETALYPKELWSGVRRKSWFMMMRGMASRLRSITMRIPSRSDSSRMSEMCSSFFSRTSSATFSISRALFTR